MLSGSVQTNSDWNDFHGKIKNEMEKNVFFEVLDSIGAGSRLLHKKAKMQSLYENAKRNPPFLKVYNCLSRYLLLNLQGCINLIKNAIHADGVYGTEQLQSIATLFGIKVRDYSFKV